MLCPRLLTGNGDRGQEALVDLQERPSRGQASDVEGVLEDGLLVKEVPRLLRAELQAPERLAKITKNYESSLKIHAKS